MGIPIVSDINYQLQILGEGHYLQLARSWVGKRRVYVHHNLTPALHRKQIGVFVGPQLISVITVELSYGAEYLLHVTSPPRSDLAIIADATYRTGWSLFSTMGAELIYTHCPTLNGHLHRGTKALCEACHLRPYGLPEEEEINGITYSWQTYQMTREWWLNNEQARKAA
jgi:hypothetical protein